MPVMLFNQTVHPFEQNTKRIKQDIISIVKLNISYFSKKRHHGNTENILSKTLWERTFARDIHGVSEVFFMYM